MVQKMIYVEPLGYLLLELCDFELFIIYATGTESEKREPQIVTRGTRRTYATARGRQRNIVAYNDVRIPE